MNNNMICNKSKIGVYLSCDHKNEIVKYLFKKEGLSNDLYWVNDSNESLENVSNILYIVVDDSSSDNINNLKKMVNLATKNGLFVFLIVKEVYDIDDVVNVDGVLVVTDDLLKQYDGIECLVYSVIKSVNNFVLESDGLVNIPSEDAKLFFNQSKKLIFANVVLRKEVILNNIIRELLAKIECWKVDLKHGMSALIDITGNENDISMFEVMRICESISSELSHNAFIIWGATTDNNLHNDLQVSMWINISE